MVNLFTGSERWVGRFENTVYFLPACTFTVATYVQGLLLLLKQWLCKKNRAGT